MKIKREGLGWRIARDLLLLSGLFLILMPLFLVVINSFKTLEEAGRNFFAFPSSFNLNNFKELFQNNNYWIFARNSLIISVISVTFILVLVPAVSYKMVEKKAVRIELADTNEKIYIEARVRSKNHMACAIIAGSHKNLCFLQRDDVILYQKNDSDIGNKRVEDNEEYTVTMKEIFEFIQNIQIEKLYFLKEVLKINREIALEGINGEYGLKVGKSILYGNEKRLIGLDVANYAVAMTAAAADARMAGCEMPVFSAAGSGNQGLTATVPVVAVGEKLHIAEENILKAAALSVLLTIHTKHYLGRLSVLCGCSISAAIGVVCGVVFMLEGSYEQMCKAISTMVADISGVVCDGAKAGCALKVATAVDSAMRAANMAMCGIGANSKDGIVCQDVEKTLKNLGTLGDCGMRAANPVILEMMLQKQKEQ